MEVLTVCSSMLLIVFEYLFPFITTNNVIFNANMALIYVKTKSTFIDITKIHPPELFKQVSEYTGALIDEAKLNGSLDEHYEIIFQS